jgi:hypothetical protein
MNGLPVTLVLAIIRNESNFAPGCISQGSHGLMQLCLGRAFLEWKILRTPAKRSGRVPLFPLAARFLSGLGTLALALIMQGISG